MSLPMPPYAALSTARESQRSIMEPQDLTAAQVLLHEGLCTMPSAGDGENAQNCARAADDMAAEADFGQIVRFSCQNPSCP